MSVSGYLLSDEDNSMGHGVGFRKIAEHTYNHSSDRGRIMVLQSRVGTAVQKRNYH